MERLTLQVGREDGRRGPPVEARRLQRDRMAVRQADPLQPQQLFAVLQLKPRCLFTGRYTQRAPQQSRAGDPALPAHLVREAEEAVGAAVRGRLADKGSAARSEEHTSELQSPCNLVCRLLLEKKKNNTDKLMRSSQRG